jgi:hypothetical protein
VGKKNHRRDSKSTRAQALIHGFVPLALRLCLWFVSGLAVAGLAVVELAMPTTVVVVVDWVGRTTLQLPPELRMG